jgi:hypothetical protein
MILWPTVSRPICHCVGLTSGACDQIFVFLSNNCRFLNVGRPLWREGGSVIYSYSCFWALPEQSLSGPSPAELTTISYSLKWDSPNLEGQVLYLYPPGQGGPVILQSTGFHSHPFLRLAGIWWRYFNPPPHGSGVQSSKLFYDWQPVSMSKSKLLYDWQYLLVSSTLVGLANRYYFLSECCCLKFAVLCLWGTHSSSQVKLVIYDRRSVGQSVLVSGTPFGPATNFSSFLNYF